MADSYDRVRLAELRDAHTALVQSYRASTQAQTTAATAAARARSDAPMLPGEAPKRTYVASPGIGNPVMPVAPAPYTNEFYLQPLAALLEYTPEQLAKAEINQRALSEIIVAETRLNKLKFATVDIASKVHLSAARMASLEIFALEKRL